MMWFPFLPYWHAIMRAGTILVLARPAAHIVALTILVSTSSLLVLQLSAYASNTTGQAPDEINPGPRLNVGAKDWPQWGGSSNRNNIVTSQKIPLTWDINTGQNIRWSMPVGTSAFGGVVVANGKVYAGANNGSGYLKRFPLHVDLGVLLCFNEADGKFVWQHSNAKLPQGRVNDWPSLGVFSAPLIDGDRLWYVTNRGEVVCLDTEGFADGEDDGPLKQDELADKEDEADVVWVFDMMNQLGVSQHNMANCSVTCAGDMLFVSTSNGVDESHLRIPAEDAPSFICLSRNSGKVLWTDNSPGKNILHGQWSSPAYSVLGGVPQVIFGGGDGYLYGFLAQSENGNSKLLWRFDCNPKGSLYSLRGGDSTRNHIIATPVIYEGLVYVAVGEDPEHGEGSGRLWCIDPTKRGDVSPTLVFNSKSPDTPIEHKRLQALVADEGDYEKPNPNSAALWQYVGSNPNVFQQAMHRTVSTVAIKNDLLFVPDYSGMLHCLDAKSGEPYWTSDFVAACWASPLIVDDRVYICDEDGDVSVFKLSRNMELLKETNTGGKIFTTPVVANDTLFLIIGDRLWAIQEGAKSAPVKNN
jgi:outer membrane protein assembly factor BamB